MRKKLAFTLLYHYFFLLILGTTAAPWTPMTRTQMCVGFYCYTAKW